jgi:tRNA(Ile)-lysidine synthase
MALLHVLARLRGRLGHDLVAHGVDHGLRAEAAVELDLAEDLARALGVPMSRTCVRVAPGGNLQARARDARYGALRAAAHRTGANVLATGHHADDRAETMILRLLRGSGPRGLAVLPPRAGDLVRPLIRAQRRDIEAHLARHAIAHASDPSNANPRFLRVRVRSEVLPLLVRLSPAIVTHLCALADQLAPLVSVPVERPTTPRMSPEAGLDALPRASRDALSALGRTKSPTARVRLPKGLVARYDRAQIAIVIAPESADPAADQEAGRGAGHVDRGDTGNLSRETAPHLVEEARIRW